MAEIANLEAVITADIKPFAAALTEASADLQNFAVKGEESMTVLNGGFSQTAKAAITAGTDIRSLTAALDVLQSEQQGIIRGSALWFKYAAAIKDVNVQLDVLEAELPVVIAETKVLGTSGTTSISSVGRSLTGMLGGLRQIAYILPGIGVAGIFNLAFEAISQAADALGIFNSEAKETAEAEKKAAESISDEAGHVQILVAELQSENTTRQEKKRIIGELQAIAPAYFGNLKLEGDTVKNLTEDYQKYGLAITLVAKIKAATELNQKNVAAEIELQLKTSQELQAAEKDRAKNSDLHLATEARISRILENQLETLTGLKQESKPLLDIIIEAQKELDALGGDPTAPPPAAEKIKKTKKEVEDFSKSLQGLLLHLREVEKGEAGITAPIEKILPSTEFFKPLSQTEAEAQLEQMRKALQTAAVKVFSNQGILSGVDLLNDDEVKANFKAFQKEVQATATLVSDVLATAFDSVFQSIQNGQNVFQSLGKALEQLILKLIATVAEAAILAAILNIIFPGSSSFAGNLKGILGIIPHAEGGIFTKPTLIGNHLFGEKGPEVLAPLSQLSNLAVDHAQNITITGRISGNDIVLVQNRQNLRNNRNYGLNFN